MKKITLTTIILLSLITGCSGDGESDSPIADQTCPSSVKLMGEITQSNGKIKRYPGSVFDLYKLPENQTVAIKVIPDQDGSSAITSEIRVASDDSDQRTVSLSDACGNLDKNTETGSDVTLGYRVDKNSDSLDSRPRKLRAGKAYYINIRAGNSCYSGDDCNFYIEHTTH